MNHLIDIKQFSLRSRFDDRWLLKNINLTIASGQRIGITGPSGSGKTTLAYCLAGIQEEFINGSTSGHIHHRPGSLLNIGMVLQNPEVQLFSDRVSAELEAARPDCLSQADKRLLLGLDKVQDKSVGALSLGQKQRLSIAAQLLRQPDVLIIDEPTNNLDQTSVELLLQALLVYPGTVLIIEHNTDFLLRWADVIWAFADGEIVFTGSLPAWAQKRRIKHRLFRLAAALAKEGQNEADFSDYSALSNWQPQGSSALTTNHPPRFAAKPALLHLRHLQTGYDEPLHPALDFTVSAGDIIAVLGVSGSGKTTFFRTLTGLQKPYAGEVDYCGIEKINPQTHDLFPWLAMAFQNPDYQLFERTVLRECAFALNHHQYNPTEIANKALAMLDTFGLAHLAERLPFTISYGEKRRLTLAGLLVANPQLLLLDEPTIALDEAAVAKLQSLLLELHRQYNMAMIFSTHDLDFALGLARWFLILTTTGQTVLVEREALTNDHLAMANMAPSLAMRWLGKPLRGLYDVVV
jgi:energy-coupling factor transporter ATP-binding protein EcfA2